jgi:copper(I)-binding protein
MLRTSLAAVALAAILAVPALAHDYTVGALKIHHPWARATPKGAQVGGGYMSITNTGTTPDRLIGGSTAVAAGFEVHEMSMSNGVMKMREVPNGLEIKPGETIVLKPMGYHIMLTGLKAPLTQGEHVDATLKFEKAGEVKVYFAVAGIGSMNGESGAAAAHGDMPGMGHDSMPGMKMNH